MHHCALHYVQFVEGRSRVYNVLYRSLYNIYIHYICIYIYICMYAYCIAHVYIKSIKQSYWNIFTNQSRHNYHNKACLLHQSFKVQYKTLCIVKY